MDNLQMAEGLAQRTSEAAATLTSSDAASEPAVLAVIDQGYQGAIAFALVDIAKSLRKLTEVAASADQRARLKL
jgi:hypothetical protein